MMDNFKIEITSDHDLLGVLKIGSRGYKTRGYKKTKTEFVLFWSNHEEATELPVVYTPEMLEPVITKWLLEEAEYGNEPDIDGHCKRGFTVSCDYWGHVKPYGWQAFLRIRPEWAMYGK